MKKRLSRWIAAALGVLLILTGASAQAAGNQKIVEFAVAGDEHLLAFVRDAGNVSEVSAMVGQSSSGEVSFQTLSESGLTMKTLILVDNSLSIPENDRTATKSMLLEFIAARKGNELFSFGTISDEVSISQDFTDDYTQLRQAIDGMEYQYQDTFLTDALYDYLTANPLGTREDAFERILLISDGVDNKSLGYTKDELKALLKSAPIPIYTVGVFTGVPGNDENLENMFSIARDTGAGTCLLSDVKNGVVLSSMMETDWNNLVVSISLPAEAQDGSLKTVTLTLKGSGGVSQVSIDQVRMPLRAADPTPTAAPTEAPPENTSPTVIIQEPSDNTGLIVVIVVLGVLGIMLVVGLIIGIILLVRTKRKKADFEKLTAEREKKLRDMEMMESGSTYFLGADPADGGEDGTLHVWSGETSSTITLTDIHTADRCYQKPISKSLIIGLSKDSDICINYDKSVSRTHCEIVKEGNDYYIINHSQSNGTLLNGNRVVAKTPIFSGAVIKMGRVEMRIEIKS